MEGEKTESVVTNINLKVTIKYTCECDFVNYIKRWWGVMNKVMQSLRSNLT